MRKKCKKCRENSEYKVTSTKARMYKNYLFNYLINEYKKLACTKNAKNVRKDALTYAEIFVFVLTTITQDIMAPVRTIRGTAAICPSPELCGFEVSRLSKCHLLMNNCETMRTMRIVSNRAAFTHTL